MGRVVMLIMTFFGIRFMRLMPTAAMVPSTVEANAETTAIINVEQRLQNIAVLKQALIPAQCKKPENWVRLAVSVSLNEKMMSTMMGA